MAGRTDPRRDPTPEAGEDLRRLAFRQAGYFTTGQALRLGCTTEDIGGRLAEGSWLRIERDLFRLASFPRTDLEEYAKWCAWFEGNAVVSHQSAAELHGLGHLHPSFVHLTTPGSAPAPTRRLALHRRRLRDEDCERAGPLRITTPLCTALDLASGGIAQDLFDEVVGDGVAIGRIDPDELRAAAELQPQQIVDRIERALGAYG
ncbi:hypothetical protein [Prescottella sp. R16]|uniref:type IV toxin-antitoxin system AbiEi family antitoxin domain-containing protein n=1 Tax=Prescottella sp. R16 TaxID=3064529 RepID=UPI00272E8BC7|nr:hypothetical protein [Prescottella sp. R16]